MSEEEQIIYDEIIKLITENKFLTINGTPMTLNEVNNYITNLQQKNQQLKEEIEEQKKYNTELMLCNSRFNAILTELEDYLRLGICEPAYIKGDMFWQNACEEVLDKIQELKEKYK